MTTKPQKAVNFDPGRSAVTTLPVELNGVEVELEARCCLALSSQILAVPTVSWR